MMRLAFLVTIISVAELNAQVQSDTVIHGVSIHFRFHQSIFPESWRIEPINGRGGSLESGEKFRSRRVLEAALSKYPPQVLEKHLASVYVLRFMNFYNVGYGGTNSTNVVFLTNDGFSRGYTDKYIEQTFHHEFSSILYRNHPLLLNDSAWLSCNRELDYNDPENGVGAIRNNESSQYLDTTLCRSGFLTQYAVSGMENDINTIAQNLFRPAENFWWAVDRFPLIARKARLLIDFYHKIDRRFTEDYFRSMNR